MAMLGLDPLDSLRLDKCISLFRLYFMCLLMVMLVMSNDCDDVQSLDSA